MSKHVSADQKLHTTASSKPVRQLPKNEFKHQSNEPPGPPSGTNAKNQYR